MGKKIRTILKILPKSEEEDISLISFKILLLKEQTQRKPLRDPSMTKQRKKMFVFAEYIQNPNFPEESIQINPILNLTGLLTIGPHCLFPKL